MDAVLIPVRHLSEGKGRLGVDVSIELRERLGRAMLLDLLDAASCFDATLVISRDAHALILAEERGAKGIDDPGLGLRGAITHGTRAARGLGADSLTVLLADVALAREEDLDHMRRRPEAVVIARSRDGGTSALLTRPAGAIPSLHGPSSADAHRVAAIDRGLAAVVVDLPSLSLDVDDEEDLLDLAGGDPHRRAVEVAAEIVRSLRQGRQG